MDKAGRLGLSPELIAKRSEGMSMAELTIALGVYDSTIRRLIKSKQLRCKRCHTACHDKKKRFVYSFDAHKVERFLRDGGALLPLKPTGVWREIYDEARIELLKHYISQMDLYRLLHITRGVLMPSLPSSWVNRGFPKPVWKIRTNYYTCAAVLAWLQKHRPEYLTPSVLRRLDATQEVHS